MKTIVAGSRDITSPAIVRLAIESSGFEVSEIVSGAARGVDSLGEEWGRANKIDVVTFPADWKKHGKAAGPMRNCQMADYADALVAVWDGKSPGTRHMIQEAGRLGLDVFVWFSSGPQEIYANVASGEVNLDATVSSMLGWNGGDFGWNMATAWSVACDLNDKWGVEILRERDGQENYWVLAGRKGMMTWCIKEEQMRFAPDYIKALLLYASFIKKQHEATNA